MVEHPQSVKIRLRNMEEGLALYGPKDNFLQIIEENFPNVSIFTRDEEISLQGQNGQLVSLQQLFEVLLKLIRKGYSLTEQDVVYALQLAKQLKADQLLELYQGEIAWTHKGKPIRPKTLTQNHYVSMIRKKDIVFGIGPAGTGKTYLAVVLAVSALKEGKVKRIILTRPAVEAGENLGFLPGDLQEKVDPYLRPLYDALYDMLGNEQVAKMMERGLIEIAPLAYMRGRTLDDSFIILDEAQNTTPEQMKMFLTRLGFGSKMVITGDITQIDLPKGKISGLVDAEKILKNIKEIGMIYFSEHDVVRHSLVQKIIMAYQEHQEKQH